MIYCGCSTRSSGLKRESQTFIHVWKT